MIRRSSVQKILLCLLALMPAACGRLEGTVEDARPAYELSPDEVRLARELAERGLTMPANPFSPLERVVFTKIDLVPGPQADATQRQVIVHHYRYRGDEVILTTVDLRRLEVVAVETIPHFPTALGKEELDRAEVMARKDARLRTVFEMPGRRLLVEGRPIQAAFSHEPLFAHRVVHLLLRAGPNYLQSPRVLVDLTTETVIVE